MKKRVVPREVVESPETREPATSVIMLGELPFSIAAPSMRKSKNACTKLMYPMRKPSNEKPGGFFTPKSTIESADLGQSLTIARLHLPKTTASYRLTVFRLTANRLLYDHSSLYGCFDHRTESIFFEVNTSAQSPLRLGLDRIIRSFVSGRWVNHAGLRRSSIAITG